MMIPISATNHLVWHGPITYWQSITQTSPNACYQSDINISKYYTKLSFLIQHDMKSLISTGIHYTEIVLATVKIWRPELIQKSQAIFPGTSR